MKIRTAVLLIAFLCISLSSSLAGISFLESWRNDGSRLAVDSIPEPNTILSSADWNSTGFINGNWNVANNWSAGVPGFAGITDTNADTASFKFSNNLDVTVDAARSIANIAFASSSAGAFTLHSGNLYFTFGGSIVIKTDVVNTETVNTPIFLSSVANTTFTIANSSANSGVSLNIGNTVTGRNGTGTVMLILDGPGNGSVGGVISNGTAGGNVELAKGNIIAGSGLSTWTVSGANTYTGSTSVTAGTLLINGNQANATGAVSVSNMGSLLGGTGTIGGAVTVNAGARITGATNGTVGTLTLASNATLTGTNSATFATYVVDLTALISDKLAIAGVLDLSNGFDQLQFQGVSGARSYTLATYSSVNGVFNQVTGLPSGYTLNYGLTALTLTTAPEPATWMAGFLAVAAVVYSQRKKFFRKAATLKRMRLGASDPQRRQRLSNRAGFRR